MKWYLALTGCVVACIVIATIFASMSVALLACAVAVGGWLIVTGLGVALIRLQMFVPSVLRLETDQKVIALTYDDGPDPHVTPLLLDLLDELSIKATFFCVGKYVRKHPKLAHDIVQRGHLIANHSDTHAWSLPFCLTRGWQREITDAGQAIKTATNITTTLFRPPVGLTNPHLGAALKQTRHRCIGWTVRSWDRRSRCVDVVCDRIRRQYVPGAIILLHDRGHTAERVLTLTRAIVEDAAENGYRCVRLDEAPPLDRT